MPDYRYFADMAAQVEVPQDGIISRTLHDDGQLRVVLFGFDTGQELSEHTASMPAVLHVLRGEATITLGEDRFEAGAGAWAHMPAHMAHSVVAKTPLVLLLSMLKAGKEPAK